MLRIAVVALALSFAGAVSAPAGAVQSPRLVSYVKTGGFVGKRDTLTIYRNGAADSSDGAFRLSAHRLLVVESALTSARFATLRTQYMPPDPVADGFVYSVTYRGKTINVGQGARPPARLERVLSVLAGVLSRRG